MDDFEARFQDIVKHYREEEDKEHGGFCPHDILKTLQSLQSLCWYVGDLTFTLMESDEVTISDVAIRLMREIKSQADILIEELEGSYDDEEDDDDYEYDDADEDDDD